MQTNKLGRLISKDERDHNFSLKSMLPPKSEITITQKYWNDAGWWGDQKETPHCVGYSWAHWLEDGPVTQDGPAPIVPPVVIYREAQKIDEWPGETYDGTSVRAGAKVLQDKGFITEYRWAFDVETLTTALLTAGPVVVGTYWYESMFYPNSKGIVKISGNVAGGHAYVLNGVNTKTKMFRIKNSWSREWGDKGHAYISFADMTRLIKEEGEVCLALEKKYVTPKISKQETKSTDLHLSAEAKAAIAEGERIRNLFQ